MPQSMRATRFAAAKPRTLRSVAKLLLSRAGAVARPSEGAENQTVSRQDAKTPRCAKWKFYA